MPNSNLHPAALPLDKLLADCDERRLRRGGPGGQHRNKVETAVELTHRPTGIAAEANERRSQQQNREVAITRLRIRLALAHRSPQADPTPSKLWLSRVRGERISINPKHVDFPTLLAEALDRLADLDWEPTEAAERLKITRSQLLKLLRLEPSALVLLNQERSDRDLKPLK